VRLIHKAGYFPKKKGGAHPVSDFPKAPASLVRAGRDRKTTRRDRRRRGIEGGAALAGQAGSNPERHFKHVLKRH